MKKSCSVTVFILALVTVSLSSVVQAVDFSRDIRPLLSDRCFECHGPDEEAREADLRLDLRDEAVSLAIVPGDAKESELLRRLITTDDDEKMPPVDSRHQSLSKEQVELIRQWIDEGAPYAQHWSFIPPTRSEPTAVEGGEIRNAVDQFILGRLQAEDLPASRAADRRTLLRRLSFDLTGLPPSPEEVEQFVADPSAKAYEEAVDRLLSSPHFGERMAMYWLDVVRYADTNGIHGDNFRPHSSYRDWVIKAFNDNKPYDHFVIDQLAGDLLPDATFREQIASGFNRLNMTTREGGAQPKEYQAIYQADRVRNTSAIFLGLTMGCSQCHDHKYDPLSMRDFYSWGAFFADLEETAVGVQNPTTMRPVRHDAQQTALDDRIVALQKVLATATPELEAAQVEWEKTLEKLPGVWTLLEPTSSASLTNTEFIQQPDGSTKLGLENLPARDEFTIEFKTSLNAISALYLEAMPDKDSPEGGPGRGVNGNFVLNELQVFVDGKPVKVKSANATFSQTGYKIEHAIDGDHGTGWGILPKTNIAHHAVFELDELPESYGKDDGEREVRVVMMQSLGDQHMVGRFRWWVTDVSQPVEVNRSLELQSIARSLKMAHEDRTQAQKDELAHYYRSIAPLLSETHQELKELLAKQKEIGGPREVLVSRIMKQPRMVQILPRGNWMDESGEEVQPGIPAIFGDIGVEGRRANRLDLAHWIASAENPLAARVQVNRLWKLAFGRGLARPLDDLGAQGRVPLHPELLDWLATEFVASGWDTKKMLKLLVTSATYRRSSVSSSDVREVDPENEFYARQNRFRLDAEMVRDNALVISGLLNPAIGGKSAKPYQPAGYWSHLNFPVRKYEHDADANQYRRGLYTYWCRTFLHPSLGAFDAPSREECTVDRPRSNTPLAALVLLNDPTYVEAARVLADRMIEEVDTTVAGRIEFAYQQALQRKPNGQEVGLLSKLFGQQLAYYSSNEDAAMELQGVGLAPKHEQQVAERAAWISVARTILNLHETISRN